MDLMRILDDAGRILIVRDKYLVRIIEKCRKEMVFTSVTKSATITETSIEKRLSVEELRKGPVTAILIMINIVVFLAVELTGGTLGSSHMMEWGAAYTPAIIGDGEWYRLFTCMFLHFGIRHLVNNMLVLFVLGGRLERTVGKIKFILIYLLGGLSGNILSLVQDLLSGRYAVSAGASGAVFAVVGGMIYVLIRLKGRVEDITVRQMIIMALFSLYFGFASSGVDNAAHVGGLLGGFVAALILFHPTESQIYFLHRKDYEP